MDSRLSIFLLFATVAQSSLAWDTSTSCAPVTTIRADLETIKFAENTERNGYLRSAQVVYEEIIRVLAEKSGDIIASRGDSYLKAKLAQNESFTGPMNGVLPNCEAIRIIQPDLDIPTVMKVATAGRWNVNNYIFLGIKAAQVKNCPDTRIKIAKYSEQARAGGVAAIRLFYSAMVNGTVPLPDESKSVIKCVQEQTESKIDSALAAIFEEIEILSKALSDNVSKDLLQKYSPDITAAHHKASDSFAAEIGLKFSVVRNLGIARYLTKTGLVTGLFSI